MRAKKQTPTMSNPPVDSENRNPSGKSSGISATIFLILFATPFAGFGLFALVQGVRKLIAGQTKDGLMLCLFGLIFSAVGFGLMFGAVWGRKKSKQTAELQARFPDKPWLARADWAAGKIKSTSTAPVGFFLLWSFLALAMSAPAVHAIPVEWRKGNHAILFALLFPAVAFYLLGYSFVKWRSRRRFGDCFFEPAQIPVPLGGTLEGMIVTGAPLKLDQGLHLKISCIRRTVSGSGKNRSVNENVLWQDEKILKAEASLPDPEPGHSGIPVFFKLPADQSECFTGGDVSVFWRLEAKSKMRGPDFSVAFDLPVFKVAGAIAEAADEADPTAALQEPVEEIRRDEHSKIQVSDGPDGREFYFPAARNPVAAVITTVFMLAFCGGLILVLFVAPDRDTGMLKGSAGQIIGALVLGLFIVILGWVSFNLWFKSSRVTIDSTGVRVTNRWLLFSRSRNFAANDIERLETKVGMTNGNNAFQDLKLITRDSERSFAASREKFQQTGQRPPLKFNISSPGGFALASGIASKPEADWLVAEMTKALGRKS
jgi:hypothetical protein